MAMKDEELFPVCLAVTLPAMGLPLVIITFLVSIVENSKLAPMFLILRTSTRTPWHH